MLDYFEDLEKILLLRRGGKTEEASDDLEGDYVKKYHDFQT